MGSIFTFIIIITILIYLIQLGIFIYNSKNKKINEIEKWVLIFIFVISIVLSLTFLMIEKNDIDKQMAQQTNIRPIIEINIEMFIVLEIPLFLINLITNIICSKVNDVKRRWKLIITLIIIIVGIAAFLWHALFSINCPPTI